MRGCRVTRYSELVALVRYRHQPGNPALRSLLARDRDVRTTLDIRLQTAGGGDSAAGICNRPTKRTARRW